MGATASSLCYTCKESPAIISEWYEASEPQSDSEIEHVQKILELFERSSRVCWRRDIL